MCRCAHSRLTRRGGLQETGTTKDKASVQIEHWVLSSINGNQCTHLFRTDTRHLSTDRFPRPTARWRCFHAQQVEESDIQVLAQWSDDVTYPRRTADYAPVNCVQTKMEVCDPSSGSSKSVNFDNDGSDSVSLALSLCVCVFVLFFCSLFSLFYPSIKKNRGCKLSLQIGGSYKIMFSI